MCRLRFSLLMRLMSDLLINGLPIIIIFPRRFLFSSWLLILALSFKVAFLPATKTNNFRFIKS
ncbi:hypothetical protein Hanom_Chr04g00330841 [Helianthus anomalus]